MTADERNELREKYKDNPDVQRLINEIERVLAFEMLVVHQGHLLSEMRAYEEAHKKASNKLSETFENGAELLVARVREAQSE